MVNPGIGIIAVRCCTYKLNPIVFLNRAQNAAVIGLQSLGGIARIGITLLAIRRYAIGQIRDQRLYIHCGVHIALVQRYEENGVVLKVKVSIAQELKAIHNIIMPSNGM